MSNRWASALPVLVVFMASTCVMVLELTASRLIAQYVGSNLYTWTGVIAVMLAGLSVGNLVGGVLADRVGSARAGTMLGVLLVVAGFASVLVVVLNGAAFENALVASLALPSRVLAGLTLVFFLPATLLGLITPFAATWAITLNASVGRTVGVLYAAGSVGAITGTLLTGFLLISALGSTVIVTAVGAVLALTALVVSQRKRVLLGAAFVVTVALTLAFGSGAIPLSSVAGSLGEVVFEQESQYQTVAVAKDSATGARIVVLDNLVHGYVYPEDPRVLSYPYIAYFGSVYRSLRESLDRPLHSLHLGGGAYTLPRFLNVHYPEDLIVVSELDPVVTAASVAVAGLSEPPPFEIVHADAREVVRAHLRSGGEFDVIFADAFTDYSMPQHLATVEFYREMDALLSPDGVILTNVIDSLDDPSVLSAVYRTVLAAQPHVAVFGVGSEAEMRGRSTFVVASAKAPMDTQTLVGEARTLGLQVTELNGDALLAANRSSGVLLTDDFAPVESLVSHLYR